MTTHDPAPFSAPAVARDPQTGKFAPAPIDHRAAGRAGTNMSIDRRIQQLERTEEQRLAAAIADFGAFWWRRQADPATTARRDAALAAAGYRGTTLAEFRHWIAGAWTPAKRAESRAYLAAIRALVVCPADHAAIRCALAALAPHLDLSAHAAPVAIIAALEQAIAAEDTGQAAS